MARRLLEFSVIRNQVRKDKGRFIRRLQGMLESKGACVLWLGSKRKPDGYGRMNFMHTGRRHVQIDVQRVFLILKLGRPIKIGYDAGHEPGCPNKHCVRHVFEQAQSENYQWANHTRHEQEQVTV